LISDFGSSRFTSDDETPTLKSGTVRYAAPEQYMEEAVPTPKTNVFSFGLVSWELTVGRPVFAPESPVCCHPTSAKSRSAGTSATLRPLHAGLDQSLLGRESERSAVFREICALFRDYHYMILHKADGAESQDF
jgi:serine/threonine protein kinase